MGVFRNTAVQQPQQPQNQFQNADWQAMAAYAAQNPDIREDTVKLTKGLLEWTAEFVKNLPNPADQAALAQEYAAVGAKAYSKANSELKNVVSWTAKLLKAFPAPAGGAGFSSFSV